MINNCNQKHERCNQQQMEIAATLQTGWTEKRSLVIAVSELYDPIQVGLLPELSDFPEEPTE